MQIEIMLLLFFISNCTKRNLLYLLGLPVSVVVGSYCCLLFFSAGILLFIDAATATHLAILHCVYKITIHSQYQMNIRINSFETFSCVAL